MKIIWTRYALDDANKAFEYASEKFGKSQIKRLAERISLAENHINKHFTACPLEQSLLDDGNLYRYFPLFRNLEMIFHLEEDDVILIDAIWDTRQNPQRLRKRFSI